MDKNTEKTEVMWAEHCRNPWNPDCRNSDVEVYLASKETKIPICRTCWLAIAETDSKWQSGWSLKRQINRSLRNTPKT